jgi:hypothetical protein
VRCAARTPDICADRAADEAPVEESPALATALKALASLTREQRAALSAALGAFVDALATAPANDTILTEKAWHNRANWGDDEWATWSIWAWYKHFCRLVSLRSKERETLADVGAVLSVPAHVREHAQHGCVREAGGEERSGSGAAQKMVERRDHGGVTLCSVPIITYIYMSTCTRVLGCVLKEQLGKVSDVIGISEQRDVGTSVSRRGVKQVVRPRQPPQVVLSRDLAQDAA